MLYLLLGMALIYIGLTLKYAVLENFGTLGSAVVTSRQDQYLTGVEARGRTGFLKALIDRHRLFYYYDAPAGERRFGNARVDSFLLEQTKEEDEIAVLYIPSMPQLHCLKPLLLVRFRELMTIGGVALLTLLLLIGLHSVELTSSQGMVDGISRQATTHQREQPVAPAYVAPRAAQYDPQGKPLPPDLMKSEPTP